MRQLLLASAVLIPAAAIAAERPAGIAEFERLCPGLVTGAAGDVALAAPLERREGTQNPFTTAAITQMVATLGAGELGTEVEALTVAPGVGIYASSDPAVAPAFANLFVVSGTVTGEDEAGETPMRVSTCGVGSTVAAAEHPSEEAFHARFAAALTPLAEALGGDATLRESGGWNAERGVFNWAWRAEGETGALDGYAEYKPGDDWVGLSVGATLFTQGAAE